MTVGLPVFYLLMTLAQSLLLIGTSFFDRLTVICDGKTKSTQLTRHVVDTLIKAVFLITPIAGLIASKGNPLMMVGISSAMSVYVIMLVFSIMETIHAFV